MNNTKTRSSKSLANERCKAEGWDFTQVFRYQFRAAQSPASLDPTWCDKQLGGWFIEHCPMLPSCRLMDQNGNLFGYVLGIAISPEGTCLGEKAELGTDKTLDQWIEDLAGRFVILTAHTGDLRVYGDPSGNLPVVYNTNTKVAASSVALAVSGELDPPPGYDLEKVEARQQFLLFGDTSDQNVTRLTPNHYLDLADVTQHRFWPHEHTEFENLQDDEEALFEQASARMTRNVAALAEAYDCALPITAGRDSRIILGSAIPVLDKIKSFYCYDLNWSTKIDSELGRILAEYLSVPFLVLTRQSPRIQNIMTDEEFDAEYQRSLLRTGWCYGLRQAWIRFVAASPRVDVVLRGTGVEMTRANKWRRGVVRMPINATTGVVALRRQWPDATRTKEEASIYDQLVARYQAWMDTLPLQARTRLYDLAHIELWLPSSQTLEFTAFVDGFVVNPFNDRRLIQLTAAVRPKSRLRNDLVRSMVSYHDPGLGDFPYHREYTKLRRKARAR